MIRMQIGDMSRWASNARHTYNIKTSLNRYANELSSKKHQDMARALGPARARHAEIKAMLGRENTYQTNSKQVETRLKVMQVTLGGLRKITQNVAGDLLKDASSMKPSDMKLVSRDAKTQFAAIVSSLDAQVGGVNLFSGMRTDKRPLPDAETILNDLKSKLDFSKPAADIKADVEAFFEASSGDYETIHYRGSSPAPTGAAIADRQTVDVQITALSPPIRSALAGVALAAIADDPALVADSTRMGAVLEHARNKLIDTTPIAEMESQLGAQQERVEYIMTRRAARVTSMTLEINTLEQPDMFETAVRLKEVKTQLETHFTITGRLAEMSLLKYI